nr:unnamed protein product [Digitaria exilis]
MTLYYHDILYDGSNNANATAAVVAQPTLLSRSASINDTYFGEIVRRIWLLYKHPEACSRPQSCTSTGAKAKEKHSPIVL